MKKTVFCSLLLCGVLFSSGTVFAAEKPCPDPNCNDPISKLAQDYLSKQKDYYDREMEKVANVNYTALELCLGNAKKAANVDEFLDALANFTIKLPSIGEIMKKACMAAVSEIRDQFNKLEDKLVNLIPYGGKIDFNDFTQDIVDGALDKVFDPVGGWASDQLSKLPVDKADKLPGLDDIPVFNK